MSRKTRRRHRSQSGSLLIFSAVIVILIIIAIAPFIAFFANLSAELVIKSDTEHIASQVAEVVDDHRFWLDALRPGYDEDKAFSVARSAAASLCSKVGMKVSDVTLTTSTDAGGNYLTKCTLRVDARNRFPFLISVGAFDMNSYFPTQIQETATTQHSNHPPYSLIHMDAPTRGIDESNNRAGTLGFNQRDVVVMPSYGFFYTAVAGETMMPTPYGKGLAREQWLTENFMSMNHYHFKKSDFDYLMGPDYDEASEQDIINNSWHPGRLYDGKKVTVTR